MCLRFIDWVRGLGGGRCGEERMCEGGEKKAR